MRRLGLRKCLGGIDQEGCPNLTPDTRCPDHHRQAESERNRRKDAARPSPAQRGYDHAWRTVRAQVLERDGWVCRWCGQPAKTADHLQPLAHDGERLDMDNLAAACLTCNSRRGGQTRRAGERGAG